MEIPNNEESALDSIEHELYDPKKKMDDVMMHRVRDARSVDLPTSWGEINPIITEAHDSKTLSFGAKILIGSCILLLLSLSFTAWRVLSSRNVVSAANIDMSTEIVPYIEGGQDTPFTVTLQNRNGSALQEASLTLLYKQGNGTQDEQEKITEKRDLGTIGVNEYKKQDFKVIVYGGESEARDLTVKLEYKVAGSNAVFNKIVTTSVVLKTPPLSVHIEGPSLLSIGQTGEFIISVKNNAATSSLPSALQVILPTNFTVESTDPKPSSRGQVWNVPSLDQGETKTFTITGAITGSQGETSTIKALVGSQGGLIASIGVVYSSQTYDIQLRSSPLMLSLGLETDRGNVETLRYGDKTLVTVTYANSSDQPIRDVSLVLKIQGDAPLLKQVDPDAGYYDSRAQSITWNKSIISNLANLTPHAQGSFRVVIPVVSKGINSPAINLSLSGNGTVQDKNDVTTMLSKSWIVQGTATLSGQTTYKNSPFQNTGPVPPQPNVDTTYTTHIVVSAQNALVNSRVSFILPAYVTWKNVTSNTTSISYDAGTRTVTWDIGSIGAGKTVMADINLSVRPSQSHVGQSPSITSGIVLDADEEVARTHIRTTISPLTTILVGENWPVDPSRVVDSQ